MGAVAFCPGDAELVTLDGPWLRRWNVASGEQIVATRLVDDVATLAAELGLTGTWRDAGASILSVDCRADGTALALGVLRHDENGAIRQYQYAVTVDRGGKRVRAPTKHYIAFASFAADGSVWLYCASDCRGILVWRDGAIFDGPQYTPDTILMFADGGGYTETVMGTSQPAKLFVVTPKQRVELKPATDISSASVAPDGSVAITSGTLVDAWGWVATRGKLGARVHLAPFGATQTEQVIASARHFITRDITGAVHHASRAKLDWQTIKKPCGDGDEIDGHQARVMASSHDGSRLAVVCKTAGVRLLPLP